MNMETSEGEQFETNETESWFELDVMGPSEGMKKLERAMEKRCRIIIRTIQHLDPEQPNNNNLITVHVYFRNQKDFDSIFDQSKWNLPAKYKDYIHVIPHLATAQTLGQELRNLPGLEHNLGLGVASARDAILDNLDRVKTRKYEDDQGEKGNL